MFFERLILIANKSRLSCWTLKRCLNFEKWREKLRRWILKRSQAIFDEMKKFVSWFILFLLINLQSFLKITYGTNNQLKLTLQEGNEITDDRRRR